MFKQILLGGRCSALPIKAERGQGLRLVTFIELPKGGQRCNSILEKGGAIYGNKYN